MMEVWAANTLTINGMVIEKDAIEINDVLAFAKQLKFARFIVKDAENGITLKQSDFPYSNSIVIEPYNEAGD